MVERLAAKKQNHRAESQSNRRDSAEATGPRDLEIAARLHYPFPAPTIALQLYLDRHGLRAPSKPNYLDAPTDYWK